MEGALVRLVAFSTITNKPLNMATAIEALKDILPPPQPKKITIESIQNTVSKYYGVEKSELLSKKRNKHIVYPRQIAMYLCRRLTEASFPQIGEQFGGRDHTTVMHANEKIERNVESDGQLAAEIKDLCEKINPDFTT